MHKGKTRAPYSILATILNKFFSPICVSIGVFVFFFRLYFGRIMFFTQFNSWNLSHVLLKITNSFEWMNELSVFASMHRQYSCHSFRSTWILYVCIHFRWHIYKIQWLRRYYLKISFCILTRCIWDNNINFRCYCLLEHHLLQFLSFSIQVELINVMLWYGLSDVSKGRKMFKGCCGRRGVL